MKCDKKCLKCRYADCVNETVTANDYLDIVDLEKALGIYLPEDEPFFYEDLLRFVRRDRKRERFEEYMQQKRGACR